MKKVVIIGSDDLAWSLINEFRYATYLDLVGVYLQDDEAVEDINHEFNQRFALELVDEWLRASRSNQPLEEQAAAQQEALRVKVLASSNFADIPQADIYIISSSCDTVARLSNEVEFPTDAVVLHTAGAVSVEDLSPKITNKGVIYPLQTFTKGYDVKWSNVPIFVEGATPEALRAASWLASRLSNNVRSMGFKERQKIDLAATLAGDFTNALWSIAARQLDDLQLPFTTITPLLEQTMRAALTSNRPEQVQRGAAYNHDNQTLNKHTQLLDTEIDVEIYKLISTMIWRTSKRE